MARIPDYEELYDQLTQAREERDTAVGALTQIRDRYSGNEPENAFDIADAALAQLPHAALRARLVERGLAESVKLQSHYAELLNMHDGGKRMTFPSVEAWLERLAALDAHDQGEGGGDEDG